MFGFHWPELIILLVIATIFFGPKRLPEIGGALGKGIRDFRKGVTEIQEETGFNELRNLPKEVTADLTTPVKTTTETRNNAAPEPVSDSTQPHAPNAVGSA
jgi:sec-independent protein translocase protein TatA